MKHGAQECPNERQVRLAEQIEEAHYVQRNFGGRTNFNNNGGRWNQGQASGYNNNFNQNEPRAQQPPYRPPGFYEQTPQWAQDLKDRFTNVERRVDEMGAQFKEFGVWRKQVDNQFVHMANQLPREEGRLPGRPEENPCAPQQQNEVRAIGLRSGRSLPEPQVPKARREGSRTEVPSTSGPTCPDIDPVDGGGPLKWTEIPSNSGPTCPEVGPTYPDVPCPRSEMLDVGPDVDPKSVQAEIVKKSQDRSKEADPSKKQGATTLPYPMKKPKEIVEGKFKRFLKLLQGLNITIPFTLELPQKAR